MTGKTISSTITKTVTLGSGGDDSPLTISSTGIIDPTTGGGIGLLVPSSISGGIIVNDGLIEGTAGAMFGISATGVFLAGVATLTNANLIEGGTDGDGVRAYAADSITNTGLIVGGGGAYSAAQGSNGGDGVLMAEAVGALLTNNPGGPFSGIIGGAGGGSAYEGGYGGAGVRMLGAIVQGETLQEATLVNNWFIEGGSGGSQVTGMIDYGIGGAGVFIQSATLTNGIKGFIEGGTGGEAERSGFYGGVGGVGVVIYNDGQASNFGTITGGTGGANAGSTAGIGAGGYGGTGGMGLRVASLGALVNNSGTIIGGLGGYGGYSGGDGGEGAGVYEGATVINTGVIIGGGGATAESKGKFGGIGAFGVYLQNAYFYNSGSVTGGAGGAGHNGIDGYTGGSGGGVYAVESTFTNSGDISGGYGAVGVVAQFAVLSNSGTIAGGYASGVGVVLGGSDAVNTGSIIGGGAKFAYYQGPAGGVGVYLVGASTLTNSKLIAGGQGGYGAYYGGRYGYGGNGGTGVVIDGGVLINAGTISGGAGGDGEYRGLLGDAVQFQGTGTVVVENGAVFIGDVVANTKYNAALELAGTSSTALTGIGTQFTNFNNISFASGAAWTIAGNTVGLGGVSISGFAAGDTIVVDGFAETFGNFTGSEIILISPGPSVELTLATSLSGDLLISTDGTNSTLSMAPGIASATIGASQFDYVLQHGTASKISVTAGAELFAEDGGKITSATIEKAGEALVVSGGAIFHTVLDNQAALYVGHDGKATSTTIKKGGTEYAMAGGVSSDTVIDGGTLELINSGGVAGKLKFAGKGGVLEVYQTEIPTTVISGFAAGDKVELLDAASDEGTVTVTKANVVTILADGVTYKLNIAGAKVGETNFRFSGFALTETAKKMAIQRPAETTEAAHALPDLVTAGGHQTIAAAPAPYRPWCASSVPYAALAHELIRVPHGGIQTMVTLQSGG